MNEKHHRKYSSKATQYRYCVVSLKPASAFRTPFVFFFVRERIHCLAKAKRQHRSSKKKSDRTPVVSHAVCCGLVRHANPLLAGQSAKRAVLLP